MALVNASSRWAALYIRLCEDWCLFHRIVFCSLSPSPFRVSLPDKMSPYLTAPTAAAAWQRGSRPTDSDPIVRVRFRSGHALRRSVGRGLVIRRMLRRLLDHRARSRTSLSVRNAIRQRAPQFEGGRDGGEPGECGPVNARITLQRLAVHRYGRVVGYRRFRFVEYDDIGQVDWSVVTRMVIGDTNMPLYVTLLIVIYNVYSSVLLQPTKTNTVQDATWSLARRSNRVFDVIRNSVIGRSFGRPARTLRVCVCVCVLCDSLLWWQEVNL